MIDYITHTLTPLHDNIVEIICSRVTEQILSKILSRPSKVQTSERGTGLRKLFQGRSTSGLLAIGTPRNVGFQLSLCFCGSWNALKTPEDIPLERTSLFNKESIAFDLSSKPGIVSPISIRFSSGTFETIFRQSTA